MLSHLSATLNGIATIRATKSEGVLKDGFDHHQVFMALFFLCRVSLKMCLQNVHTSAWYLTLACMGAVGLWLDVLCVLFLLCIVFGFILMADCMD